MFSCRPLEKTVAFCRRSLSASPKNSGPAAASAGIAEVRLPGSGATHLYYASPTAAHRAVHSQQQASCRSLKRRRQERARAPDRRGCAMAAGLERAGWRDVWVFACGLRRLLPGRIRGTVRLRTTASRRACVCARSRLRLLWTLVAPDNSRSARGRVMTGLIRQQVPVLSAGAPALPQRGPRGCVRSRRPAFCRPRRRMHRMAWAVHRSYQPTLAAMLPWSACAESWIPSVPASCGRI